MSSSKKRKNSRQPPHKPGVAAGYLSSNFGETPTTSSLKNGHVLHLYVTTDRDIKATESKLRTLRNEDVNHYAIKKLVKCFLKFRKLTDAKEFAKFEKLCDVDFAVVPVTPRARLNVNRKLIESPCQSSPVKTRKTAACGNCKILRRNLQNCIREKNAIRNEQNAGRKRRDGKIPIKRLNEKLNRKNKTISKLNVKLKVKAQVPVKTVCTLKDLKNAKRRAKYQKEKASYAENDKKSIAKEAASQVREIETNLQDQLLQKEEELADAQSTTKNNEFSKDGKTYNFKMRIMVYECLMSNVPTANIPGLIQSFAKRFGLDLEPKDIPVRSTVENMVIELGLISDLQVSQLIYNAEHVTLGFDATTQEGIHVNAIHTTSKDDCLVVALDQLPGGTADDYATHIIESVEHLARVMCDFEPDKDYHEVKEKLVSHISSTMTDRAAANHAAIRIVNETFGKSLLEVNCHLHPLDTIASKCRSTLLSLETVKGKLLGFGCFAEKVVLALNKMRFKDSKGDPHGFRVFLSDHKLPQSLIIRYRGNRLHVLFKLAAVYVKHFEAINLYLTTRCLHNSPLKTGLIADFSHPVARLELKILAILGKVLTGPWMKHFYRKNDEQIHHLDAFNEVKMCTAKVEVLIAKDEIKPSDFSEDFFGEKLDHSEDPLIWKDDIDGSQFSVTMKALLKAVLEVIQRQYKKYYNDMEDTAERRHILESARTHNIDSEEVMGMFSANNARAPRATLLFVSSKIRSKKNDTLKFIESHPEKDNIIRKSVSLAAHLRRKTQKSMEDLLKELSRRIANKMQKKEQTERRKIEKTVKGILLSEDKDPSLYAKAFPTLDKPSLDILLEITSGAVVGRRMLHNWSQPGSFIDKTYNGKIEKHKITKKTNVYKICYWDLDRNYEDSGEDTTLNVYELASDYICGDLQFLS